MHIDLLRKSPICHWDINASISQYEFQFGSRLIFVEYPKGSSPTPSLQAAQLLVQRVWDDSQNAITCAEPWFRAKHPDFWKAWDKATAPKHPLIVYSIRFGTGNAHPTYLIGRDPLYDFTGIFHDENDLWDQDGTKAELPYFADSERIVVERITNGQFALGSIAR